jgi:hypothetical protein
VTVGSGFPTAPTRVPVDVEIELWPSVPMGKQDLDVEGRSNIADSQYKSSVKFVASISVTLIMIRLKALRRLRFSRRSTSDMGSVGRLSLSESFGALLSTLFGVTSRERRRKPDGRRRGPHDARRGRQANCAG